MSEVINWLTRDRDKYAISGASVYDGSFETWFEVWGDDGGRPLTLEEFLDVVAESWDLHFEKDNMPRNGGHFVFFVPEGDDTSYDPYGPAAKRAYEKSWRIEEWDAEDSADFLSDLQDMIKKHWHENWSCGFGHLTSEAFYEINWRRHNV